MQRILLLCILSLLWASIGNAQVNNPIIFVAQVPQAADFATIGSTFANHIATVDQAPRGGDLYIRYPDGTLRNLTREAGYGGDGMQGANSIAVRDPSVHWDGNKVIFSMVVGAPTERYQADAYRWQLYEMTGLGQGETVSLNRVEHQPVEYNNIMPIYGTNERIIFASDRPHNGSAALYPQLDEYESTPTNTGLWSLDPIAGDLFLLDHAPSGDFHPIIDSVGRVVFTRWDHLVRDQQNSAGTHGAFNYTSESSSSIDSGSNSEVFPEPRFQEEVNKAGVLEHDFNHFFPWQVFEDGTELETLNHLGRHDLHEYFNRSKNDDAALSEFIASTSGRINQHSVLNLFHMKEDFNTAGLYFCTHAPEFGTHSAGQLVTLFAPEPARTTDTKIEHLTHPDTADASDTPGTEHTGLYRDPLPLQNGTLLAVHTSETRRDENDGTRTSPTTRYDFRIKLLSNSGSYYQPTATLTSGLSTTVSYWDPDELVIYTGPLWELQPVELISRTKPATRTASLKPEELAALTAGGTTEAELKQFLKNNELALIVMRNVTTRDADDRQQPFNLRVAGTNTVTSSGSGQEYSISHFQVFQGDLIRGYSDRNGRRVLAQPMHALEVQNPENDGPQGAVRIASDGSVAAVVPARRALSWQLLNESGEAVVRERYWVSFQPGEIRVCTSCHGGVKTRDQAGQPLPKNTPTALTELANFIQTLPEPGTPSYTIAVKVNGVERKKIRSGKLALIDIRGQNSAAANKSLKVAIALGKYQCTNELAFTSDEEGNAVLQGRLPRVVKNLNVALSLRYLDTEVASYTARLKRRGKKKRRMTRKARVRICKKLATSFS